jgi:hypothetical protein
MSSDIRLRSIWITNAIGFESVQVSKIFDHYGKISQIIVADPDKGEFMIVYHNGEVATKALAFDGKTAKGSSLNVKISNSSRFESVVHALTFVPEKVMKVMSDLDASAQHDILELLKGKQRMGGSAEQPSRASGGKVTSNEANVGDNVPNNVPNLPNLYPYIPRVSQFSGNEEKLYVSYAQWRHEVMSLLAEYQS